MELSFRRTDSTDNDFVYLVKKLDEDLEGRYGERQKFFNQFNSIEMIKNVIIAYVDFNPVGCGAFKFYKSDTCEIKRMFVLPATRGKKIGARILQELEQWANEEGFQKCILETGKNQAEAIHVYQKAGYLIIPNYDQYAGVDISLCMEKMLEDRS
jgi:putative acetyltransferase